ncbi:MAG TPA: tetratricopeptide repeat protein, partial [Candidatus Binatia bacterium]|nr:tetratricopeptide repeat protein [Candidatus Binatia bacterium]
MNTAAQKKDRPSRAERRRANPEAKGRSTAPTDTVWFVAIFGSAFLLRVIYLLQIESIPLFYNLAGDGRTYDEWAQRIAAGDWLGKGVFYQAPLYPYFLGLLQAVVGHNLWLIRLIQVILGALSCALVFLAGRNLFSRTAAIASGLILAGYAPAIFFDGLIEKSILDLSLLSLLLLLLGRSIELQLWTRWLVGGAVAGFLGLSRENALVLILVVPLWIALYFSSVPQYTRLRWTGLFFLGLLIVLAPVGLRNLTIGGELTLTTSQFGPNFFIGNNPSADGTYGSVGTIIGEPQLEGNDAKRLAETALGRSLSPGEVSAYWFQQSLSYIRSEPWEWLRLLAKKWWLVWNAREIEDSDDFYIYQQWSWLLSLFASINHFGILAPLAVAGLWFTRNRWRQLWLLYAMILSLALSVAVFYVFGRYRFPLVPLLALFAGAALAEFLNLYKKRAWPALVAALGILLVSAVIVNWPIYRVGGPGAAGYNNLSNAFYKQGRVDEAITTALKAVRLQPDYGVAHYNLGNLYASQGRFELAKRHFEEALKLYPNYADAHSNLGQLLAEQGDIDSGISYFR